MKRKKSQSGGSGSSSDPDIDQIHALLRTMAEHNLEEFEYSRGDLRIRLKKPSAGMAVRSQAVPAAPEIIVAGPSAESPSAPQIPASPEARSSEDLHVVKSPIVGTFYGSPSPGAEPFVKV